MISKFLGLATAFIELFTYSGICFGYSFLQYIFQDEKIFYKEKCAASPDDPIPDDAILCEDALSYYNFIFTCCIISASIGVILLGVLEVKLGQFWTRIVCNTMTTSGLVLLTFYESSGYYIMACWWLISFPAIYYITSNCCLIPFFPAIGGLVVVMLPATFDMSAGLFLVFKIANENGQELVPLLQILAACSALLWIRTFALMPAYRPDPTKSVFQQSFIGQCFTNKVVEETSDSNNQTEKAEEGEITLKDIIPVLKSPNTWQYAIFYTIICCRIKSIQGWIFPWLDWTYSNVGDVTDSCENSEEAKKIISDQLDFYGYTYFVSPIVALVPGLISTLIKALTKNEYRTNMYTLLSLMTISVIITVTISVQMVYQAEDENDTANSLAFICLFTLVKTWFFATPPLFSFTFYPIELISAMYGIITIPSVGFQWVIDPLFKLVLNGDCISDGDFGPVSIGFAVACGISGASIILTFILGRRKLKKNDANEVRPDAKGQVTTEARSTVSSL